jgi:SAM-dependent methyltransferase
MVNRNPHPLTLRWTLEVMTNPPTRSSIDVGSARVPGPEPWHLDWQPNDVARFWAWHSSQPAFAGNYFSANCGDALLRAILRVVPLDGIVVDLGAARGDMTKRLLERGVKVIALDQSAESVALITQELGRNPHLLGAMQSSQTLPLGDASADVVLIIETLEHVSDELSASLLSEIRRVLRSDGYIFATVPNSEDLARSHMMCPRCGCVFHTIQHQRNFTATSLKTMMEIAGFRTQLVQTAYFTPHGRVHAIFEWIRRRGERIPNDRLLYVGRSGSV